MSSDDSVRLWLKGEGGGGVWRVRVPAGYE